MEETRTSDVDFSLGSKVRAPYISFSLHSEMNSDDKTEQNNRD